MHPAPACPSLACSTDPYCTSCAPGKPDVCTMCAMWNDTSNKLQWGVDKASGKCVDCRIKHCARQAGGKEGILVCHGQVC